MEHDSAAAAVLQLLSNRSLPEVGQLPILLGTVPMLERQELPPLFGVEDTQQLLTDLQVRIFHSVSGEEQPISEHGLSEILYGPSTLFRYLMLPPLSNVKLVQ